MYILIPVADLAVTDPGAGGGQLDVPSFQDFDVIHAVLAAQIVSPIGGTRREHPIKIFSLFELSPNHVGEYFKSLVRVKTEAVMRLDPVLVDNSQTSKGFKAVCEVLSASNPGSVHHLAGIICTHGGTANVYNP
jgi:hypothetical protein